MISVVRRIPAGRVATYGDVAKAAGKPRAARAVGNIMRQCAARDVPCHRVIAAAGRLGGFGGHLEMKRALLRAEGILVGAATIRDFENRRWPSAQWRPTAHELPGKRLNPLPASRSPLPAAPSSASPHSPAASSSQSADESRAGLSRFATQRPV